MYDSINNHNSNDNNNNNNANNENNDNNNNNNNIMTLAAAEGVAREAVRLGPPEGPVMVSFQNFKFVFAA